jgi:glutamate formiminotransferase
MRNRKIPVLSKEEWSDQKERQKLIMERKKKFEEAKRKNKDK